MSRWAGKVREYTDGDRPAVEACFRELQEFEQNMDLNRVAPETIAEPYVDSILRQCKESAGKIYVAETEDRVVAFLCVWLEPTLSGMISRITDVAFISDVVVSQPYRRRGIGTALLAAAEAFAASAGVPYIVVRVLAGNHGAQQTYRRAGFADYDLRLLKPVSKRAHDQDDT